jgi:hypothetical protein
MQGVLAHSIGISLLILIRQTIKALYTINWYTNH